MLTNYVDRKAFCESTGITKHALSNALRRAKQQIQEQDEDDLYPIQLKYGNTRYIRPVPELGATYIKMIQFRDENRLIGLSHVQELKNTCTIIDPEGTESLILLEPLFAKAKELLVKDNLFKTDFMVAITDEDAKEFNCDIITQADGYSLVSY